MAAENIANFDVDLLGSDNIKEPTINSAAIVYRGLSERHLSKEKTGVLPGYTPVSVCISFQGVAISKREFPIRGDASLFQFSLSQITYCGSDKTYPANLCFVTQPKQGDLKEPLCVVLRTESPSKSQAIIKSFQKICKEKMRAKEEQRKHSEETGTSLWELAISILFSLFTNIVT